MTKRDPRRVRLPMARREFLGALTVGGAVLALPFGCSSDPAPVAMGFFSDAERKAIGALADHVLPPDQDPGGAALGAATYIEGLLTAFDVDPPRIYAGGPFSGRQPFADPKTGAASDTFPENEFARFLPLPRAAAAAWRLRLYGSAGVPGGGPNDSIVGPTIGLRDLILNGVREAVASAPGPLETLDNLKVSAVWGGLPDDFQAAFTELVMEAAFSAPEYGGNTDGQGLAMIHVEGDSQPLGYSVFNETTMTYQERLPVSTAEPGPDLDPLDAKTHDALAFITGSLGGKVA